ncbi:hypothetical protein VOLCADRAFT_104101 [Volvox carteri f. nagariensis]|uniref:Pre-mRNA-splicing factor SPF27 n=1 Tax=Volvox carteri f. nagariensis TaxID=3068 RepID=D8TR90_VOLCA|nr:uncharacterized protein VOLCADRAFT_104101 [Volvox carteri f. nagariensis]EFJ49955.1 hypothetical protein VOLCADRAFT_104101 [Volvox carteri f. nagariensis]|eukprot:XP_002949020.1 hypothetical protein VOLCADRAFT_104101 [Volvox carteri f. nagariensis]
MATKRPLALDYTAHGTAKGWRANEHLIDALPYVDHVPAELRPVVDALIEEEKRKSAKLPSDYLRELPPVRAPQFDEHPVLKTEYERVRSKQPMQPLDTVRYRLDPPPQNKRGDVNAWRQALENAHSQLEHQHLRILNQELLLKHGDKSWRAQVQHDEATIKSLEQQLTAIKKETDQLNRERKLQQLAAGAELSKLERHYMAQVRKNWDIERACTRLEEEVAKAEAELQRRLQAVVAQASASDVPRLQEAAQEVAEETAAAVPTTTEAASGEGNDAGPAAAAADTDVEMSTAREEGPLTAISGNGS